MTNVTDGEHAMLMSICWRIPSYSVITVATFIRELWRCSGCTECHLDINDAHIFIFDIDISISSVLFHICIKVSFFSLFLSLSSHPLYLDVTFRQSPQLLFLFNPLLLFLLSVIYFFFASSHDLTNLLPLHFLFSRNVEAWRMAQTGLWQESKRRCLFNDGSTDA
jgi:hypothetical protein